MSFKCYYCLKKYHNGNDYIQHCRSDHLDSIRLDILLYIYNASLCNPVFGSMIRLIGTHGCMAIQA